MKNKRYNIIMNLNDKEIIDNLEEENLIIEKNIIENEENINKQDIQNIDEQNKDENNLNKESELEFNHKIENLENINKDDTQNIDANIKNEINLPEDLKLKFYENLKKVVKAQENILMKTFMAKEKIKYANEISLDQLKNFKENTLKYGKYLKQIHEELALVSDLMKKIKKDIK